MAGQRAVPGAPVIHELVDYYLIHDHRVTRDLGEGGSCPWQGVWNWMILTVSSNPTHDSTSWLRARPCSEGKKKPKPDSGRRRLLTPKASEHAESERRHRESLFAHTDRPRRRLSGEQTRASAAPYLRPGLAETQPDQSPSGGGWDGPFRRDSVSFFTASLRSCFQGHLEPLYLRRLRLRQAPAQQTRRPPGRCGYARLSLRAQGKPPRNYENSRKRSRSASSCPAR